MCKRIMPVVTRTIISAQRKRPSLPVFLAKYPLDHTMSPAIPALWVNNVSGISTIAAASCRKKSSFKLKVIGMLISCPAIWSPCSDRPAFVPPSLA